MEILKTVGVKNLKNQLSAYLREVKRGARILITERDHIVAELRKPLASSMPLSTNDPLRERWLQEGKLIFPTQKKCSLLRTPLHSPEGTALQLIAEDRGE